VKWVVDVNCQGLGGGGFEEAVQVDSTGSPHTDSTSSPQAGPGYVNWLLARGWCLSGGKRSDKMPVWR